MLDRNGFEITWDVSYRSGELDGKEIQYKDGQVERLRTFNDGVQHGLERRYYDSGALMSETIWVEGVVRSNRGWHRNGRIASETTCDAQGRMHGLYRMWNEDGTLWFERPHRHGKQHGRYRKQGHSDHWFWNGQSLGGGDYGKKRFMALLAEEE